MITKFNTPQKQSIKGIIVIFSYKLFKFIKSSIVLIVTFFIAFVKSTDSKIVFIALSCFSGILIIMFLNAVLKYHNFKFYIDGTNFILNKGVFLKEKITVSKYNIQNINIKQNSIQQFLQVVSLSIETAGNETTEIKIQALTKHDAELLKKQLLEHTTLNIEKTIEQTNKLYFKASIKKLLLEGISENHIRSFFIVLAFFVGFYNTVKSFFEPLNNENPLVNNFEFFNTLLVNTTLFFLILIISFMYSFLKTVCVNYELSVLESEKGLEISKGLFNKIKVNLSFKRIQNVCIETNVIKQKLNLFQVKFYQALASNEQLKNFKIIGLEKKQAYDLVEKFYENALSVLDKHKPERYFFKVKCIHFLVIAAFINVILLYVLKNQLYLKLGVNCLILVYGFLQIKYSFKKAYFALSDEYLIVGTGGFLETKTEIIELHKIQSVHFKQTLFQKPKKIASIMVSTASKMITIPFIQEKKAKQVIDFLLYKIESQPQKWM